MAVTIDLTGRTALITGAGRGQGRAHAIRLGEAGASVVCVDFDSRVETIEYATADRADLLETVALVEQAGGSALAVQADVRSQEQLDEAVSTTLRTYGGLDIVVANAGVWGLRKLWELSEQEWSDMQDIVLAGVWRTVKACAPHLMSRRAGSIILTSSVNGMEGGANFTHYTAAKHGVLGFMRAAALELGPFNIRVNAVCPGFVDSKMNEWQGAYDMMAGHPGGTPEDRINNAYGWNILPGRGALNPSAVSDAVLFLAGDLSTEVTGVALPVDGGHLTLNGINLNPVRSADGLSG